LEWIGLVVGMERGRTVKKILRANQREVEEWEELD
jgi:hypothetical protein